MNYTAEIVAAYVAVPTVDTVNELAAKFIVAKLSAEKVKAKKEGVT